MATSAPAKGPSSPVDRVPPDESLWERYSPHGEAPISAAASVAGAQAFDRRHYVLVGEADAGAQQILIVDGRVALDRHMPSILIVFVSHS